MRKENYIFFASIFSVLAASAQTEPTAANTWKANFKRVALDISNTTVKNANQYQNSTISSLASNSESMTKGVFDFALENQGEQYQWNNSLYMAYGETKVKPYNAAELVNETDDQILAQSDLSAKIWKIGGMDVGPFGNIGYQTEFTSKANIPLYKVAREKAGIKLFNGKYVKELYIAGFMEEDFTYSQTTEDHGWEAGTTLEYQYTDVVKFQANGYYRKYMDYSIYHGTNLRYDMNLTGRMDVKITKVLSIGPFIAYRQAHSKEADVAGSNMKIGISISYSDIYDLL